MGGSFALFIVIVMFYFCKVGHIDFSSICIKWYRTCCCKSSDRKYYKGTASQWKPVSSVITSAVKSEPTPPLSEVMSPTVQPEGSPSTLHSTTSVTALFQSGKYNMRYHQYGRWHGPFIIQLEFKNGNITGYGTDDVGSFTATGSYVENDPHLSLIKYYKHGTGDPQENLGHTVKIDLVWNDHERNFDGTWFVKTVKYTGKGRFQLQLKEKTVVSHLIVEFSY